MDDDILNYIHKSDSDHMSRFEHLNFVIDDYIDFWHKVRKQHLKLLLKYDLICFQIINTTILINYTYNVMFELYGNMGGHLIHNI